MWGVGSAGQHTVISMLASVGKKNPLLVLVLIAKIRRVSAPFFPLPGQAGDSRCPHLNSPQMRAAKWKLAPESLHLPTSLLQIHNKERGKAQCKPSFALTEGLQ